MLNEFPAKLHGVDLKVLSKWCSWFWSWVILHRSKQLRPTQVYRWCAIEYF